MKTFKTILALVVAAMIGLSACDSPDVWNKIPPRIQDFITEYFPGTEVETFATTDTYYYVQIKDGPGLSFDKDGSWTRLNGFGMPLPEVLIYDQSPEGLYDYLEATEQVNAVFAMSRDASTYRLKMLSSYIDYDISTGKVTVDLIPED